MYSEKEAKEQDFIKAVVDGSLDKVTQALKNGVNINLLSEQFKLPKVAMDIYCAALHYAIFKGNKDLCKLLSVNGADVSILCKSELGAGFYTDPLISAARRDLDIFDIILTNSTENSIRKISDTKGFYVLKIVIQKDNLKLAEKVWAKCNLGNKRFEKQLQEELFRATENNNFALIEFLIKKGADVNIEIPSSELKISPVEYAVSHENNELVRLFIKNGADIDNLKLLYYALQNKENKNLETFKLLMQKGLVLPADADKFMKECSDLPKNTKSLVAQMMKLCTEADKLFGLEPVDKNNLTLPENLLTHKEEIQQLFIDRLVSNIQLYGIPCKDEKIISVGEYISEITKLLDVFDVDLKNQTLNLLKIIHDNYEAIAQVEISLIAKEGILPISYDDALYMITKEKDLNTESLNKVIEFYNQHPKYKIPGQYMQDHIKDIVKTEFACEKLSNLLSNNTIIDNDLYSMIEDLLETSLIGQNKFDNE